MTRSRAGGLMALYRVALDFADGPSFEAEVSADGRQMARRLTENMARGCGFDAPVRHVTIVPLRRLEKEA